MSTAQVNAILDKLSEVSENLARLEEKFNNNITHEERIRKLELWRAGLGVGLLVCLTELQVLGIIVTILKTAGV